MASEKQKKQRCISIDCFKKNPPQEGKIMSETLQKKIALAAETIAFIKNEKKENALFLIKAKYVAKLAHKM
jgi:hypothetical protein